MNDEVDWKEESLKRIEYLEEMLIKYSKLIVERSYEHSEMCILTNTPSHMYMGYFDNLDRICREAKLAVEKINA